MIGVAAAAINNNNNVIFSDLKQIFSHLSEFVLNG